MANIIDRRANDKNKSAGNRKRFIDRYKNQIKKAVESVAEKKDLKDFGKDEKITIPGEVISEPTFEHDHNTGDNTYVIPGNDHWIRGDKIAKPPQEERGSSGSPDGDGEDDFTFVLTKEEFMAIYFSDVGLPNFIKKAINKIVKFEYKKKGLSKDGIPARMNLKKTLENAYARRLAARGQGKKGIWLDDSDVRYNLYLKDPLPIRHAVMFCVMDVSGSMEEWQKALAKKFYILLNLFLQREYESVEIVFIRYTQEAKEVDEKEFFYSTETGGTVTSVAYELVLKIIEERYTEATTNFYLAHASDGDNWDDDTTKCIGIIEKSLLPKLQYLAYIQIEDEGRQGMKREWGITDLMYHFQRLEQKHRNFRAIALHKTAELFGVFRKLFKKEV